MAFKGIFSERPWLIVSCAPDDWKLFGCGSIFGTIGANRNALFSSDSVTFTNLTHFIYVNFFNIHGTLPARKINVKILNEIILKESHRHHHLLRATFLNGFLTLISMLGKIVPLAALT